MDLQFFETAPRLVCSPRSALGGCPPRLMKPWSRALPWKSSQPLDRPYFARYGVVSLECYACSRATCTLFEHQLIAIRSTGVLPVGSPEKSP
jgi:hypothetical protein